jgi:hypothetical protein
MSQHTVLRIWINVTYNRVVRGWMRSVMSLTFTWQTPSSQTRLCIPSHDPVFRKYHYRNLSKLVFVLKLVFDFLTVLTVNKSTMQIKIDLYFSKLRQNLKFRCTVKTEQACMMCLEGVVPQKQHFQHPQHFDCHNCWSRRGNRLWFGVTVHLKTPSCLAGLSDFVSGWAIWLPYQLSPAARGLWLHVGNLITAGHKAF